jgi:hypothetical protein
MKRARTSTPADREALRMLHEITQFLAYAALVAAESE